MKVRDLVKLLVSNGWREVRTKGSHRHFKHPTRPLLVTVPGRAGMEVAAGTLAAILKKADLK